MTPKQAISGVIDNLRIAFGRPQISHIIGRLPFRLWVQSVPGRNAGI